MQQGLRIASCICFLALLNGCAQNPERPPPMSLDCAQLRNVPDDVPDYLRPPTQVVEVLAAADGKFRWKKKTVVSDELQNALVNESSKARITEIDLLSGGQSISIGHLLLIAGVAKAVCARAMVERNGELQPLNFR